MIYLNDKLVPDNMALVSVFDRGFLYGDGIYETLRSYKGCVFMLDEHVARLFRSAESIGLDPGKKNEEIKKAVYSTLSANRLREAVIRITVSRGTGPAGLDPSPCRKPTFVISARRFRGHPVTCYRKGVKIAVVNTRRNFRGALDPAIKSLNFLNNIQAKRETVGKKIYEAIMLDYRGYVAEGTISNIFFIKNDILCTSDIRIGILDGITRKIILETAGELGIRAKEGRFRRKDIYQAEEVFISNTTMEVMPVSEIDGITVSKVPGTITRMLHSGYRLRVNKYINEYSLK